MGGENLIVVWAYTYMCVCIHTYQYTYVIEWFNLLFKTFAIKKYTAVVLQKEFQYFNRKVKRIKYLLVMSDSHHVWKKL